MCRTLLFSRQRLHMNMPPRRPPNRELEKKVYCFFFFFSLICILCLKQNDPDKAHILPSQRVQTHEANGPEEAGVIIGSTQNVNHSANIYWDVSLTFKRKWEFVQYSAKHFVQMHLSQFCDHSTNS